MLLLMAVVAFMACDETPTTQRLLAPAPATMDIVSGNSQSAPAGTSLPNPIVVRVRDDGGAPVSNQVVNFKVTAGGGTVFAGTSLTNSDGVAQEHWTLGPTAGSPQTLEARAVDGTDGSKQVFATFTATATDPTTTVASVTVSPASSNLVVGGTQQLAATAKNADGAALSGLTYTWSSSNTNVATVSSAGLVTARAAGNATISAATGGRTGSATVAVTTATATDTVPPGTPGTPSITTTAVNADTFSVAATWSAATDAAKYTWTTGANSGGFGTQGETTNRSITFRAPALTNANGYWFCVSAVDAAGNGSEDSACNAYAPPTGAAAPTVATVTVSPASASLAVGATQQLSASARDASGTAITGKTFTWSSSNTTVATVSSAGLVTARASGSATVTASVDGKSATASVTVTATAPTVATVSVTPATASVTVGGTQQLAATAKDASGNTISGKTFTWSSSNTTVATVNSTGLVTAKVAGTATITASVDGRSGTAAITAVALSPPPPPTAGVWYEQTWQSVSSLPQNGSAPGIHYATNASIQSGTLFDGSTGRFVRAQYPGGGVEGTASVALRPSAASENRPREIWGEAWVRVPSDWSIKSDDKTFFHMEDWSLVGSGAGAGQSEVWRWAIYLRNGSPYGGPYYRLEPFENFGNIHTSIFNGQWFRLRYHFKMASNTTATDGIYEVWINDRRVTSRVGIRTDSAPEAFFGSITLGANADPLGSGSRDWGRVRLFTSNPGW
jgi:uncharacterized protein YjdB